MFCVTLAFTMFAVLEFVELMTLGALTMLGADLGTIIGVLELV